MNATLRLVGYPWTGNIYSTASTFNFIFVPFPSEITKSIEPPWRISNLGNETSGVYQSGHRRFGKAKWRKKIKIEYGFTGECSGAKRKEIEWLASKWAKYQLLWTDSGGGTTNIEKYFMECPYPETSYNASNREPIYLVITSCDFTQTSKEDWFKYNMKLTRVDKRGFSNEATPGS